MGKIAYLIVEEFDGTDEEACVICLEKDRAEVWIINQHSKQSARHEAKGEYYIKEIQLIED